jgi:membrane fusion protein, multidrug efflux system
MHRHLVKTSSLVASLRSVVAVAAVLFAAAPLTAGKSLAQNGPMEPAVTVANPLAKRITLWDEYSGRAEAVISIDLRARVSGYIEAVHFRDGSLVEEGDLLFTIEKRPFELAVDAARADVERREAEVAFARADVERAEPLAKTRVLSEQVFDQRKASLSIAQANLLSAKAALQTAELNLEWAEVRAPIAGRISDKKVDPGNLVTGGQNGANLLATLVSIDPIQFIFDVSEADHLRYSRLFLSGQRPSSRETANPVRLRLADEKSWSREGRMDFVDNVLNERSGTIRGRAIFDNKDGLLTPGMFARLELFGGEQDALLVPDTSIVAEQARKTVYVVGSDNTVTSKIVTLGPIYEGLRVITGGLDAGDRVVISGLANPAVRPGAKVVASSGDVIIENN